MAGIALKDLQKTEKGKESGHRILTLFDKFLEPNNKFSINKSGLTKSQQDHLNLIRLKKFVTIEKINVKQSERSSRLIEKQDLRTLTQKEKEKKYILNLSSTGEIWFDIKLSKQYEGLESIDSKLIDKQNILESTTAATGGGSESLGVRAETLITEGKNITPPFQLKGIPVQVKCFDGAADIKSSIIKGLKSNPKISKAIENSFIDWGSKGWNTIEWKGNIPPNEINQLGKYAGEVMTGVMGFVQPDALHWRGPSPIGLGNKQLKHFCVPDDPAFVGVDVFFVLENGEKIAISNKFGKGAAASFFANILPYMMEDPTLIKPNSVLADLVKIANDKTHSNAEKMKGRGAPSKEILYEYGFTKILKIKPFLDLNDPNPYVVYTNIKNGLTSEDNEDISLVVSKVDNYLSKNILNSGQEIKNLLPNSLTSFFARTTAQDLNLPENLDPMLKVLAGKNFWQANLNQQKWKEGIIHYDLFNSARVELEIIGSKGAIKDIEMKEGMLNYFMKG